MGHARRPGNGAFRIRGNPLDYGHPVRLLSSPQSHFAAIAEDITALSTKALLRTRKLAQSPTPWPSRALEALSVSAFISNRPLLGAIRRNISFSRIRRSTTYLGVNATNTSTGELETFVNADFTDDEGPLRVLASAALPGFYPAVSIGDQRYIDGAVLAYTKLAPVIDAGARNIFTVYVDPGIEQLEVDEPVATVETLYRMFIITWVSRLERGIRDLSRLNRHVVSLRRFVEEQRLDPSQAATLYQSILPPGRLEKVDGVVQPFEVSLHRFNPGNGRLEPLGLTDLSRERVQRKIDQGFADAAEHDCAASGCVLASTAA